MDSADESGSNVFRFSEDWDAMAGHELETSAQLRWSCFLHAASPPATVQETDG